MMIHPSDLKGIVDRAFDGIKAEVLEDLKKLDDYEGWVEMCMQAHLRGYIGVISHKHWAGLRADIAGRLRRALKDGG